MSEERLKVAHTFGKWYWADVYGLCSKTAEKNPNENVFTRVWIPDSEEMKLDEA